MRWLIYEVADGICIRTLREISKK